MKVINYISKQSILYLLRILELYKSQGILCYTITIGEYSTWLLENGISTETSCCNLFGDRTNRPMEGILIKIEFESKFDVCKLKQNYWTPVGWNIILTNDYYVRYI